MRIFRKNQTLRELTSGEQKRHELSSLVYDAANLIQKPRVRTDWMLLSNGALESCGHVTLGRKGNVISLYTPAEEEKKPKYPAGFNAVEVYVFHNRYEKLAYTISNTLMNAGYEVGIRRDFDDRIIGSKGLQ